MNEEIKFSKSNEEDLSSLSFEAWNAVMFKRAQAGWDEVYAVLIDSETQNAHVFMTQAICKVSQSDWQELGIPLDKQFLIPSSVSHRLSWIIQAYFDALNEMQSMIDKSREFDRRLMDHLMKTENIKS